MKVGIVGCGLIGQKRARSLGSQHQLVAVADIDLKRAEKLASDFAGCEPFKDWSKVINHPQVEIVIVATTNNFLTQISLEAVAAGKHVLVEKPGARNAGELEELVERASSSNSLVKVGFNHRFHPAFLKARQIWETGDLGDLMYLRARYGHGGRLGYDKEWRADPEIAGGGELLDQGVHLIDLARLFAGDFSSVAGQVGTYFWNMPVEDNGFMFLKTPKEKVAWLHVSCTEWKNLFSFELFGQKGKLQVDGLGGSYGVEKLTFYKRLPEMGPPETIAWEYPGEDKSWVLEFNYFIECIKQGREPEGNLRDALAALIIIRSLYQTGLIQPKQELKAEHDNYS